MTATGRRVLWQIRRDPRTIALLLGVPVGLLTLLRYVFDSQPATFEHIGAPMCGLFPFIVMFLITSIAMLRERTSGTLERLMSLPISKQALLARLRARVRRPRGGAGGDRLHGRLRAGSASTQPTARGSSDCSPSATRCSGWRSGLFASAFARTEFQAVQFMPAIVFPQLLLCGLFVPRSAMAVPLQYVAYAFPLTYAFDALSRATHAGPLGGTFVLDVARRDRRDPRSAGARRGHPAPPDAVGARKRAWGFPRCGHGTARATVEA